jgi:hemolysin activation/secretion protein
MPSSASKPLRRLPASSPSSSSPAASSPPFPRRAAGPGRLAAIALLCCAGPLAAQMLPSSVEPGREPLRPVMPQPSLAAPQIKVSQGGVTQAPPGAEALSFVLSDLAVEGATAYAPESLRPLYEHLLGRKITLAEAFAVGEQIELRYRNAGYVTSRVIVPEQTLADDGRFRIVVVEGFVSEVTYNADIGPARAAVERLIAPLRGVKPISVAEIERRLLLSNDLAGLTVRASLEPSPTVLGGSVIVVRAQRRATDSSVAIGNRNSPYLGRAEIAATHTWNAFGERADRVSLNARVSAPVERSASIGASYDALVSDNGLTAGVTALYAVSRPGRELKALDVRSQVASVTGSLTYPLIRSREQNLRAVGQFDVRDVDTDITGSAFTRDRLRIARLGLSYDRADSWNGITAVRGTLHKGLDAFGATERGSGHSRENGDGDFLKFTVDLTRLQQLTERTSLVATFTGQWSQRALLASEEFGLGGGSFGRAYDDGEISADRGVAGSLELRYAPRLPELFAKGGHVYGFLDGGRLNAARGGLPVSQASVASTGAGVRANLGPVVFATFEIAKPISHKVKTQGDKHPRAFVTLNASF